MIRYSKILFVLFVLLITQSTFTQATLYTNTIEDRQDDTVQYTDGGTWVGPVNNSYGDIHQIILSIDTDAQTFNFSFVLQNVDIDPSKYSIYFIMQYNDDANSVPIDQSTEYVSLLFDESSSSTIVVEQSRLGGELMNTETTITKTLSETLIVISYEYRISDVYSYLVANAAKEHFYVHARLTYYPYGDTSEYYSDLFTYGSAGCEDCGHSEESPFPVIPLLLSFIFMGTVVRNRRNRGTN